MYDGTTVTTFTYSAANRLALAHAGGSVTTYTYDLAGNRTASSPPATPSITPGTRWVGCRPPSRWRGW